MHTPNQNQQKADTLLRAARMLEQRETSAEARITIVELRLLARSYLAPTLTNSNNSSRM